MTTTLTLAAGTWHLTAGTSSASFTVGNLFHKCHGTVPVLDGTVEVDEDGRPTLIEGSLDLGAIDTGNPRRDRDLRKPTMLDLDNHPAMTFKSRTITPSDTGWHVTGRLRIRDIAMPVSGEVTLSDLGSDCATLTATAQFDRKPIGIKAPSFVIGRVITVSLTGTVKRLPR
jgi:polyisoprenoid-binding protein YceI